MTVEECYEAIAEMMIAQAGTAPWDYLQSEITVYATMIEDIHWLIKDGKRGQGNGNPVMAIQRKYMKAVVSLRDNILQSTGERIWSMVFSLNRDKQFSLEYGYDRPPHYDGD